MSNRLKFWRRYDPGPADPAASKAYRWCALPLGLFFLYGAILLPVIVFLLMPDCAWQTSYMPPFESPRAKKLVFLAIEPFWASIGYGFVTCRPRTLRALWVYFIVVMTWQIVGGVYAGDR